jgi:rubrerythrin
MADCKRCLLLESAEKNTLDDIRQRISKLSNNEKVPDETYINRLEKCKECDDLISGVCMKCGCYVEFRAAFKRQRCPNANDRRW